MENKENVKLYTQEGFDKLVKELDERKLDRNKILDDIATAKGFGDLSENSEYDEARNNQAINEARIEELTFLIEHAKVVDESTLDASEVNIGSKVKVYDLEEEEEVEYSIVGSNQADPMENRISDMSPIGKALLGSHAGDVVTVMAPGGQYQLEVREVSRS